MATLSELIKFIETGFNNLAHRVTDVENRERSEVTGGVQRYTVANLPTATGAGSLAFATNGLKVGDTPGAGTGVLVYADGSAWRRASDDTVVST